MIINNKNRIDKYYIKDEKFKYSYFATFMTDRKLNKLQRIADKFNLIEQYNKLKNGLYKNKSENRLVLHHLLRSNDDEKISADVEQNRKLYLAQKDKCFKFADDIKNGNVLSCSGEKYKYFVQIGVGGSILGAKFLYNSLAELYRKNDVQYSAVFISNIDNASIHYQLKCVDVSKTLFIFASKSGGTKEIEINKKFIEQYVDELKSQNRLAPNFDLHKQSVALTSIDSPMAKSDDYFEKFFIDNNIGGRFSISSVFGLLINAIIYPQEACEEFINGMMYMDNHCENRNIRYNAPLLSALMNYYEQKRYFIDQNIISPYSDGLRDFPGYLAQLFMESLGKDRDQDGKRVYYRTGQFFFGERGISCQHSFYQMLHNGTASANIEFIAFTDKKELFGNCLAQSIALYERNKENFHRKVLNKILCFEKYSAFNIGQIVSFYENKVMFLGFLYNINSYDQPGVEFGKKLYKELEKGDNNDLNELVNILVEK